MSSPDNRRAAPNTFNPQRQPPHASASSRYLSGPGRTERTVERHTLKGYKEIAGSGNAGRPDFFGPLTLRCASTMYAPECLPPILDFLDSVEMPFKAGPFGQDGFLPGIQIVNGVMLIDPDRLAGSGDVLHEAGHIVIVPSRWRSALGNDVLETLDEVVAADPDAKDDFKLQTAIKMSEFMAQAWSYAALKELDL